ncbi:MAG TPA: acyltransferase [Verrucomicrobiae bacterium]|nr:acyltransferase [Verrucomicrobiae bacterium]
MNEQPLVEQLGNLEVSPYRQYLSIFVGDESLWAFIRYEVLTGILGPLPGALGYFLRARSYPWIFDRVGRRTIFGRGVILRSPGRISLGESIMIDDGVVLDAKGATSRIELGSQILLGCRSILSCNDAQIRIGNFVSIGPFCFFACKSRIEIGSNVSIGAGARFMAGGHDSDDPDTPIIRQARSAKGITIEDGAWIGTGAIILDGVTIAHDSIVGAGAVVNKDVPPWSVVLGNPARVVQKRKEPDRL